ncbi:hypothetical protein GWK47_023548 [Chionoecetes opilio]|uniref:Reverse transcriptase/retrotransposon-derived protein RNase H-like domain-containing protein n=1 Tax=Chionoecetes opilio TaxID=41210 RepID=A0A8J5BTX3_CHIOP|nr:hypothetical protein GWK47_023548 [Chionoecetes opilio]
MESGVTLRPDKFHFCRRSVTFAGYLLGWEGYQPSRDLVKSITDFKMPAQPTLTDVRSWFGLVNQVCALPGGRPCLEPFRGLLKKPGGKAVYWDKQLEALFTSAKDTIGGLAAEGLRFYDVSRPTAVLTDYSPPGIGFLVLQQYCECVSEKSPLCCPGGWKLVLCGSRHLTRPRGTTVPSREKRLPSPVPKKGTPLPPWLQKPPLVTDHKALTRIFGDKGK